MGPERPHRTAAIAVFVRWGGCGAAGSVPPEGGHPGGRARYGARPERIPGSEDRAGHDPAPGGFPPGADLLTAT
ncbi:hypothetical protein J2X68_000757 [Streptomyces sp. 3330]|nr:hypothetical protein [Streptomyces sp. 3330]